MPRAIARSPELIFPSLLCDAPLLYLTFACLWYRIYLKYFLNRFEVMRLAVAEVLDALADKNRRNILLKLK